MQHCSPFYARDESNMCRRRSVVCLSKRTPRSRELDIPSVGKRCRKTHSYVHAFRWKSEFEANFSRNRERRGVSKGSSERWTSLERKYSYTCRFSFHIFVFITAGENRRPNIRFAVWTWFLYCAWSLILNNYFLNILLICLFILCCVCIYIYSIFIYFED